MKPATRFLRSGSVMRSANRRTDRMNPLRPAEYPPRSPATKWLKTMSPSTKYFFLASSLKRKRIRLVFG